jgi:hypothetical protein
MGVMLDEPGLPAALQCEIFTPGVRNPDLHGPQSRRAKAVAVLLNPL